MQDAVQSVVRGLNILEIVAEHNEISLKEISALSGLNKATVHRLLSTLIVTGYIEQVVNKNGVYRPTYKLFSLGNKKVEHVDSYKIAHRFIRDLANTIQSTVHLVVEDGTEVVYVDKIDPSNNSGFILKSKVGKKSPMYCTSVGKALISNYPDAKIKEIWEATEIKALTPKTIINFEAFLEEIHVIRSQGYAIDAEEYEIGLICIGCEFYNHKGLVEGAISTSVPIMYFESKSEYYINHVKECAANISKALGYVPS